MSSNKMRSLNTKHKTQNKKQFLLHTKKIGFNCNISLNIVPNENKISANKPDKKMKINMLASIYLNYFIPASFAWGCGKLSHTVPAPARHLNKHSIVNELFF